MRRLLIVGLSILLLGVAGFFVWVWRANPNRGVAIRFLGYQTNAPLPRQYWTRIETNCIAARFSLTNGSHHDVVCDTYERALIHARAVNIRGAWRQNPILLPGGRASFNYIVLTTNQATEFYAPVSDFRHPLRVTLLFTTNAPSPGYGGWMKWNGGHPPASTRPVTNSFLAPLRDRVSRWFRPDKEIPTVSITIQDN